jgi:luciferase family oxidoreductase group 1
MKLSILDQSPVSTGMTATQALANTVDLAEKAEALGFFRYWVSEHHNDHAFAHAAPEILLTHLASRTQRMRIGSGGVLLTHYSPYKVAEQFNLLSTLFPGRIDLGIGRSGGGEGPSDQALRPWGTAGPTPWQKLDQLSAYLGQGVAQRKPFAAHARPLADQPAQVWVLGTSPASAKYAGERGLPYAFGGFIDPRLMVQSMTAYHQAFQPSTVLQAPKTMLTWVALAAETEADATELGRSAEVWFVRTFIRGGVSAFPSNAEAHDEVLSPQEEMLAMFRRQVAVIGTAEQVAEGLHTLQREMAVDEISVVTLTAEHKDRVRSYELIAGAMGT